MSTRGHVKWWNDAKGYGFIESIERKEYFVHYTALKMEGFKTLAEGQAVTFDAIGDGHPKGAQAMNVHIDGDQTEATPQNTSY